MITEKTKKCYKCKNIKKVEYFYRQGESIQGMCIDCSKQRHKEYYPKNKEKYIRAANKYKKAKKDFIDSLKSNPCVDCGKIYPPICMDFDHIDSKKSNGVSALLNSGRSMSEVLSEIKKCELVCSNCHRIRTWKKYLEN